MKLKFAALVILTVVLGTATVSAALLPAIAAPRTATTQQTTWSDLQVKQVAFPENLDIDVEAVYVIKTPEQWAAFWSNVPEATDPSAPTGEIPYVDFTHQFAVIASYGWKDEGYAISVTHAKFNGKAVFVTVDRQTPNPLNCRPRFDPFFGGIAIVERPAAEDFTVTPVGAVYQYVLETRWANPTRGCGGTVH